MINNTITLTGHMLPGMMAIQHDGRTVHHEFFTVARKSGTCDTIPVIIPMSACKFDGTLGFVGKLKITGEIRTTNRVIDGRKRHVAAVYAKEVTHTDEPDGQTLEVDGVICKEPIYRKTPLGREITDIVLAVRHTRGSDYIPLVTWGMTARQMREARVGDIVRVKGRFQSRPYRKKLDVGGEEVRTAYEISAKDCRVVGFQRRMRAE